jgi:ABC-type spermidine/putrescine transport system permease subunit II
MPETQLTEKYSERAISPKVTLPVILQFIALAATTASTLSWDETQWVQSALIVLTAVAGYWIKDPQRGVE